MKRFSLLLLGLVMLLSLTVGCSQGSGQPAANGGGDASAKQEKVELRYARWGIPEELNGTVKMLEKFMEENPNISVKLESTSWDEFWQKLQTQVASDSAPDAFMMDAGWYLKQYAPKGVLKEITPLMAKDGINKDDYFDVWATFTYDGKVWAMPRDFNSMVLYYNKDLFKKAGVTEYPNGDMTWDQVLGLAQKLTLDKNGKRPTDPGFDAENVDQYGLWINPADIDLAIETFLYQNGTKLVSPDGKECFIDTPEAKEVIQYMHDISWKYNVCMTPSSAQKYSEIWFSSGKNAMVYQGSWYFATMGDAKFDWDITVPPTFNDKIYCVQSCGNSIYERTKHPDEAWKLVKFLTGKGGETVMTQTNDAIPALKEVAENVYLKGTGKPENKKAVFDVAVKSVPYIDFPGKGEIFDGIRAKLEPYFNNQQDIDSALKAAKEEFTRILSKQQ